MQRSRHGAQRHCNFVRTTDILALLRRDWQRSLRSRNLAESTQRIYDTAARQFTDWLAEHNPG